MGGTAYETESERQHREGGEEMKAKMQIVLDEKDRAIEQKKMAFAAIGSPMAAGVFDL